MKSKEKQLVNLVDSLVIANNEEIKKAKGVNKNVVTSIRHKEYVDLLFNQILSGIK